MNNASKKLGDYLRDLRQSRGLSMRQLADVIGTGAAYISKLENCKLKIPKMDTIERIVSALDGDINKARGLYVAIKAQSLWSSIQMDKASEREFVEVFIYSLVNALQDFSIQVGNNVPDDKGMVWDIALNFKQTCQPREEEEIPFS